VVKAGKQNPSKKPKYTDKEQSERFIETARKLGIEETGKTFERTFAKIIRPKQSIKT
jgi:hypothetical protein